LAPDDDVLAVRMGGEEFLLLLRGSGAAERAERRRLAIAARVSIDVPGLDRLVTASMGLVEHPARGSIKVDFSTLYAQCDRLLYEAKDAGRNRTMREKLSNFGRHNRASAAAA
ncbi:MAG: diguanylate cyclase, partial [Novosphingobium sp.]|nr:diguanylate cyclase [Novosphingobium sp.]